jgi:hypothetical protein
VPAREYILETEPFFALGGGFPELTPELRSEQCEEFGERRVRVFYPEGVSTAVRAVPRSMLTKLKRSWRNDWYSLQRLFRRRARAPGADVYQSPARQFVERTHLRAQDKPKE